MKNKDHQGCKPLKNKHYSRVKLDAQRGLRFGSLKFIRPNPILLYSPYFWKDEVFKDSGSLVNSAPPRTFRELMGVKEKYLLSMLVLLQFLG